MSKQITLATLAVVAVATLVAPTAHAAPQGTIRAAWASDCASVSVTAEGYDASATVLTIKFDSRLQAELGDGAVGGPMERGAGKVSLPSAHGVAQPGVVAVVQREDRSEIDRRYLACDVAPALAHTGGR